jgi:hypothetical protein
MTVGSPLSSIISNIFIENLVKAALEETDLIPKIWLRCVQDMFTICPHGESNIDTFLNHLNGLKFTIE